MVFLLLRNTLKGLRPLWFSPRAVLWSSEHSPATNSYFKIIQVLIFLREEGGGGAGGRQGGWEWRGGRRRSHRAGNVALDPLLFLRLPCVG